MAMMMKLRTYAKKIGHILANEAGVGSCGAFNSKTMMVMRMAITPSLNASIRFVFMRRNVTREGPDWQKLRVENQRVLPGDEKASQADCDQVFGYGDEDVFCI